MHKKNSREKTNRICHQCLSWVFFVYGGESRSLMLALVFVEDPLDHYKTKHKIQLDTIDTFLLSGVSVHLYTLNFWIHLL